MPAEYWEQGKEKSRNQLELEKMEQLRSMITILGLEPVLNFRNSMKKEDLGGALKSAGEFGLGNLDLPVGTLLGVLSPALRRSWGKKGIGALTSRATAKDPYLRGELLETNQNYNQLISLLQDIKKKAPGELPDNPLNLRKVLEQALELEGEGRVVTQAAKTGEQKVVGRTEESIRREKKELSKQSAELQYQLGRAGKTIPEKLRLPRVMYHATPDEFVSEGGWFSDQALGKNTGAQSAKKGHFVAGSPKTAESYTNLTTVQNKGEPEFFVPNNFAGDQVFKSQDKIDALGDKEYENFISKLASKLNYPIEDTHNIIRRFPYDMDPHETMAAVELIEGGPRKIYQQPATIPVYVERGKQGTYSYHGHAYGNYGDKRTYTSAIADRQKKGADTVVLSGTYDGGPYDDIVVAKSAEQLISALSPGEVGSRKLRATLLDSLLQLEERKAARAGLIAPIKRSTEALEWAEEDIPLWIKKKSKKIPLD